MLLHETKNEDGIRNFFNECYELYIKVILLLTYCCSPYICEEGYFFKKKLLLFIIRY